MFWHLVSSIEIKTDRVILGLSSDVDSFEEGLVLYAFFFCGLVEGVEKVSLSLLEDGQWRVDIDSQESIQQDLLQR